MNDNEPLARIAEEVEYLLARRRWRVRERPRLVVVHGHHRSGTICLPGESIEGALLLYPAQQMPVPVRLSLAGLMLCDCMVRFHHTLLSIGRMERILKFDPFYRRLGANSYGQTENAPKFTRSSLRVYVARLREQIAKAMREGGSSISAGDALVSERTDSNVVVHRLNLPVEIFHQNSKLM